MKRRLVIVAGLSVVTLAGATACSSSGASKPKAGSNASTTSSTGSTTNSSSASAGLTEAQGVVNSFLQTPANIAVSAPLTTLPPTGKKIISLVNATPVKLEVNAGAAAAAAKFGWSFKNIQYGATPEAPAAALEAAIDQHPDAINISGTSAAAFGPGIERARKAGIPIISDSSSDPANGPLFLGGLNGPTALAHNGILLADYIAVASNGKAKVAIFNVPVFPVLQAMVDSFQKELARVCPSCSTVNVAVQVADIGTRVPSNVVSRLQADPSINWSLFSFGDLTIGVDAALKAAGLSTHIAGESPTASNLVALRNRTEVGTWIGFPARQLGYQMIDVLARYFTKQDYATELSAVPPVQLLTDDNAGQVALTASGLYAGAADFADKYYQLWGVK